MSFLPRDNSEGAQGPQDSAKDTGMSDAENPRATPTATASITTEIPKDAEQSEMAANDDSRPRKVILLPEPPIQEPPANPSADTPANPSADTPAPRRVIELPPPPIEEPQPEDETISDRESTEPADLPTEEKVEPPSIHDAKPEEISRLGRWWRAIGRRLSSSFSISLVVHVILLFTLAMIVVGGTNQGVRVQLSSEPEEPIFLEPIDGTELEIEPTEPYDPVDADLSADVDAPAVVIDLLDIAEIASPQPMDAYRGQTETTTPNMMMPVKLGGGMEGRGAMRARLAKERGATEGSERAVENGLRWLASHQADDGAWYFDLNRGPCRGQCASSGTEISSTAATGLTLLPFLGAGYTHKDGPYKTTVQRGLYRLTQRAVLTQHGLDLREGGTMYAQALATIAICEAYAMTKDEALRNYAQEAIDFIVHAQHTGGGWRYQPGEPGDTTVTGWQVMALKSARMAGLEVPSTTFSLIPHFLSQVDSDYGSQYGYRRGEPLPRKATTAVALLCRMLMGWRPSNPALRTGVMHLSEWGPIDDRIYYNYYATQVLCHFEGPQWEKWNEKMRETLIATQCTQGHEKGSWFMADDEGAKAGGRIYCTAMAVITLEVYYRYMPLYTPQASNGELY